MLTMIRTEMLFVPPIHQPIVASPVVRVDDAVKGHLARDRGLWRLLGGVRDDFRVDFTRGAPESRRQSFYPRPRAIFSHEHGARRNIGFIDFNLAGEGR